MIKTTPILLRFRWLLALAAGGSLVFSFPILLVWQHDTTHHLARANAKLEQRIETVRAEIARTQIEVDRLLSPSRVERFARENLDLRYPRAEQVVFVAASLQESKPQTASMWERGKLKR